MKSDVDSLGSDLNFSLESYNSNSKENSKFKFSNSFIINNKEKVEFPAINIFKEEDYKDEPPNNIENFKTFARKYSNRNENDTFTFKNNNSNKYIFSSSKDILSINRNKSAKLKDEILNDYKLDPTINNCDDLIKTFTNVKGASEKNIFYDISNNETIKIYRDNSNQISNKNKDNNFITLKDVNANYSKKIKKKLKRRKKLQKLKELLKLLKLKISKNLVELYANHNIIKKANSNDILSNSHSSSNYNINSQIITSSSSDEGVSSISKFKIQSLKRISSESFEIKSSYKNFNILSKGEIIKNGNFGKFLENSINIYFNKYGDENKKALSLFSSQKNNNKEDYFIDSLEEIKINNENEFFSKGYLTTISKKKYLNIISEVPNHLLNKKIYLNINNEKTTNDKPASTGEINQNSYKLFEKSENSEKIKISSFKKFDNELKKFNYNIKNNISEKKILKGNLIRKNLL